MTRHTAAGAPQARRAGAFGFFGSPYHGRDLSGCPPLINAYSPAQTAQSAVVDALVERIPFAGRSPIVLRRRQGQQPDAPEPGVSR